MPTPTSLKPIAARVAHLTDESMMRRGDLVRMANSSGSAGGGGDDTDGSDGCDCGNCLAGTTIHDGTQCCTSHLRWSLTNPWLECEDTDLTLEYAGADVWLTEPFDGPDCDGTQNEYRWKMTPDIDGTSYLTLVLETDNGCDDVCVVYGRDSFDCQCDNVFHRRKPYGTVIGVRLVNVSCEACIKPLQPIAEFKPGNFCGTYFDTVPAYMEIVAVGVSGFSDCEIDEQSCAGYCVYSTGGYKGAHLSPLNDLRAVLSLSDVQYTSDNNISLLKYSGEKTITIYDPYAPTLPDKTVSLKIDLTQSGCPALKTLRMWWDCPQNSCSSGIFYYESQLGTILPGLRQWFLETVADDGCSADGDGQYWQTGEAADIEAGGAAIGDGVCNETCDPPPAPEDLDEGTCCYQSVCYELWDEALCADFGGVWSADGCGECETTGTCIIDDELCLQTTEYVCEQFGGTFTVGENCPTGSVTYNTQGDYTWTPGFTGTATAYVHGAGGGGVRYGSGDDGGGGGGGGVAIGTLSVTSGVGVTIRVGAGGAAGGGAGTAGGESYVGSSTTIRASGGGGANGASGGSAGAGTHGTTLYTGGAGGTPTGGNGGCGGGSSAGTSSNGNAGASESGGSGGAGGVAPAGGGKGGDGGGTGVEGIDGEGPGGGGGGAGNGANLGGNGHDGRVYITW